MIVGHRILGICVHVCVYSISIDSLPKGTTTDNKTKNLKWIERK